MKEIIVFLHQGDDAMTSDPIVASACISRDQVHLCLEKCGYSVLPVILDDNRTWIEKVIKAKPLLIFNGADLGFYRDILFDGHVPAVLEILKIPYTGSNAKSVFFSNDKYLWKQVFSYNGLPVPKCFLEKDFGHGEFSFGSSLILKFRNLHNSEGIDQNSIVRNESELLRGLRVLNALGRDQVIAEEYIEGEEICSGFIGNASLMAHLPMAKFAMESRSGTACGIRDFEAKWTEITRERIVRADFSEAFNSYINQITEKVAELCGITDYARIDFRVREEGGLKVPYIIDVNPNPDISGSGTFSLMASYAGLDHCQMIERIVTTALQRYGITC